MVPLKVKVKVIKELNNVILFFLSFGPLPGDSKAIKEDQSISLLHTLALTSTAAPRRRKLSCVYALAWMSLARTSTPIEVKP